MSNYTNDTKPSQSGFDLAIGVPMGLLLTLTYAEAARTGGYSNDSKPSANSYSFDSKPS